MIIAIRGLDAVSNGGDQALGRTEVYPYSLLAPAQVP